MKAGIISFAVGAAATMMLVGVSAAHDANPSPGGDVSIHSVTSESYDSSSLTEVRSLSGFPAELTALIGWHKKGSGGIANVGEDFNATDSLDDRPSRRFLVGGVSNTSALVAYEEGGWGTKKFATAYVHLKSGWAIVARWRIDMATTLREVQSETSRPSDKYF